jgi:hypothetical protein
MPTVTLAELDSRVLGRLEANSTFYTQAQRYRAINNAIKVMNLMTGFIQNSVTVYSQPNRTIYDVPTGVVIPLRLTLDGQAVQKASAFSLSQTKPLWITETSDSTSVSPYHWAPMGITKFGFHPADSNGGKLLEVTGVANPPLLVNTTDVIGYPNEFADGIEDYAAHILMMKAGGSISIQSMYLFSTFQGRVNELKRFKQKIAPLFRVVEAEAEE